MKSRIDDLADGQSRYKPNRTYPGDVAMAKIIQEAHKKLPYEGDVVRITDFGKPTVDVKITNWGLQPTQTTPPSGASQRQPGGKGKNR
jgi:hypothetical protein